MDGALLYGLDAVGYAVNGAATVLAIRWLERRLIGPEATTPDFMLVTGFLLWPFWWMCAVGFGICALVCELSVRFVRMLRALARLADTLPVPAPAPKERAPDAYDRQAAEEVERILADDRASARDTATRVRLTLEPPPLPAEDRAARARDDENKTVPPPDPVKPWLTVSYYGDPDDENTVDEEGHGARKRS